MTHHVSLEGIVLKTGSHPEPKAGSPANEIDLCLMEAVAYFAGEPHTDHPVCASPVITSFAMRLNDRWGDDARQRLVPFIPRIVGTADPALEETRRYLIVDWAVRDLAPRWLRRIDETAHADALGALPPLTDKAAVVKARKVIGLAPRVIPGGSGHDRSDARWRRESGIAAREALRRDARQAEEVQA